MFVTYDGVLLAKFERYEAFEAHCLQFATVYNYGANYEVSAKNKQLPQIRNWFIFVTMMWGIRFRNKSKGDGVSLKQKAKTDPMFKAVMELIKKSPELMEKMSGKKSV